MTTIKVKYMTLRPRADGTRRYYWQPDAALRGAGWKLTPLGTDEADAIRKAQEINARVDLWRAGDGGKPDTRPPGSIAVLIDKYKASPKYKKLAPITRRDYDRCLVAIADWADDTPYILINSKMVQDLYAELKPRSERRAAYVIVVLRILFNYADKEGLIGKGSNPAASPDLDYAAKKGRLWSPESVAAFVAAADASGHFSVGTAAMLNEWIGQRPADVIKIRMDEIVNNCLLIRQNKTGAEVPLDLAELPPHITARVAQQVVRNKARPRPGVTLIQQDDHTTNGQPFTDNLFSKAVRRVRDLGAKTEPALAGLIFKDLRHTAVTRLSEASATTQEIAAITGHSLKTVETIIDRYNIRTTKMARNAFIKRRNAEERNEP